MSYCSYDSNSLLYYVDENKLFSFITTFTFAVIGVFIYILRSYTFFEKRHIPRANRPSAPFGNIKDVLFQETTFYLYLWKYYNRFKRKGFRYGGLYLFLKPSVLIVDPKLTREIFSEETCLVEVYRRKQLKCSKKIVDLFNDATLNHFVVKYNSIKNSYLINDLSGACISTVLHDFFTQTACVAFGFQDNNMTDVVNKLLNEKTRSSFMHYFCLVYPLFKRNKSAHELQTILNNVLEYRKKNDINDKDVINGFSNILNEGENFTEALVELFDIFVDHIIYSSSSVLFCLYELATNDDIQEELIGEIRRFNNKENKSIDLVNLQQLIYLDAVVKETLRKYPPKPTIFQECKEEYKVTEFNLDVPKGTFILSSIFGIHHDVTNFPDPETFNPDRFSQENIEHIKPNTYIPFGVDPSKDIGLTFTTTHIKLGLIAILSSFRVSLDSKKTLEFDSKKLTVYPRLPLPIKFEQLYSK